MRGESFNCRMKLWLEPPQLKLRLHIFVYIFEYSENCEQNYVTRVDKFNISRDLELVDDGDSLAPAQNGPSVYSVSAASGRDVCTGYLAYGKP